MSKNIVLDIENVSKQYRLGKVGTGTLSHDLNRWWASIRGKEDPYLKIGETNDRSKKGSSEYVWALRDVNFQIEQGDAVGIIGRNGAGKSTLLKLLSRVTKPTTGSIKYKGRIASLLEVGTGFHPEMTGRENIYLNGAILGMTKKEITRKFDEIVDFSGVERYIDTPVKRYSSGMYVRLAFAVAAHLESEILIVDEVLAVGDAEFQKKCLGKMGEISKGEGRTVIFVSHHMASIQNLCNTAVYMEHGTVKFSGNLEEAVNRYLIGNVNVKSSKNLAKKFNSPFSSHVSSISLHDVSSNEEKYSFRMGEEIKVRVECNILDPLDNIGLNVRLNDAYGQGIAGWRTSESNIHVPFRKNLIAEIVIKDLNIFDGNYYLTVAITNGKEAVDVVENVLNIEIVPERILNYPSIISKKFNLIYTPSSWCFPS